MKANQTEVFQPIKDKKISNIVKILVVFILIAFLMTISQVAKVVSKDIFPALKINASPDAIILTARNLLVFALGAFLLILAAKFVLIPIIAVSLAVVGIGLMIYTGKMLFSMFKKKRTGIND